MVQSKINILVLGSGGREHALAWKIAQSPLLDRLYIVPGNAGTESCGQNISLDVEDSDSLIAFCHTANIGLVVIGAEAPLVAGLCDELTRAGITAFGPSQAAAQLEGSKAYTKALCDAAQIPTAAYEHFTEMQAARDYIDTRSLPIVIKADGLAAGKGVTIASTRDVAYSALEAIFDMSADGTPAAVIEDYLDGEEASFFVLCDGTHAVALAGAQDHKRAGEGDTGANTGGMGAYAPTPVLNDAMIAATMEQIIHPTLTVMAARGTPYRGILFAGLMIDATGPKLIEYNVRFGDPECQALMLLLESDLVPLLLAAAQGQLEADTADKIIWRDGTALVVVMANQGYPRGYTNGDIIGNLSAAASLAQIFHAGTRRRGDVIESAGGRVLNISAVAPDLIQARKQVYTAIAKIKWSRGFYRRDIGWRALKEEDA